MTMQTESFFYRIRRNIRNKLIAGLIVTIPILGTLFIFQWVFNFWDQFLKRPIISKYPHYYVPGIGIVLSLLVIYGVGLVVTNFLGSRLMAGIENVITKIPFVRGIYSAIKQVVTTVTTPSKNAFKKVVIVDFPRQGVKMIGFLTAMIERNDGKEYAMVFLPTTPNPTTGFLAAFPKEEVQETDVTVEEGMKIVVSGGIISSEKLSTHFS